MTASSAPDDHLNRPADPARLGADQGPGDSPREDPRDMSPIMARADDSRTEAARPNSDDGSPEATQTQGSDFDQLRRQGAAGSADNSGAVGRGQGMGRAGYNGDEDRGYDPSGHRGGLGSSGGQEDLSDRHFPADANAFTGGYGGADYDQPDQDLSQQIGMNSRNPGAEAADELNAPAAGS